MPFEKQLYIAGAIAVALVLPTAPWIYFFSTGILPFPSTLVVQAQNGNLLQTVTFIVLWVVLVAHMILSLLFLFMHYCSSYCRKSLCCLCTKEKSVDHHNDEFFWVEKERIKKLRKENITQKLYVHPDSGPPEEYTLKTATGEDETFTVWKKDNKIVAMETNSNITLHWTMGGDLHVEGEPELPALSNFYVCRGLHDKDHEVSSFSKLETLDPPLIPEKLLAQHKQSQLLFSCCEKASRDPDLENDGICAAAGYKCLRRVYTEWWQICVYFCVFVATICFLWVSLASFVDPQAVVPWYAFVVTVAAFFKTQAKYFSCLNKLWAEADELTPRMRFASEGIRALFDDEGSQEALYKELVDYINSLLFFKGFSLKIEELVTIERERPDKPVIIKEKDYDPEIGAEVTVYLPSLNSTGGKPLLKIKGTIKEVNDTGARKKYDVLYDFESSEAVQETSGRTRFYAVALKYCKLIPAKWKYPQTKKQRVNTELEKAGVSLDQLLEYLLEHGVTGDNIRRYGWEIFEGQDAVDEMRKLVELVNDNPTEVRVRKAYTEILSVIAETPGGREQIEQKESERGPTAEENAEQLPPEPTKEQRVNTELEKAGVSLDQLLEYLLQHGVTEDKMPLYGWLIFPEGQNAVDYMRELVKNKQLPLEVVAAYMGILSIIQSKANDQLEERIYHCLGDKEDYVGIAKLLESIDKTTAADELEEEKAKRKPNAAKKKVLEDKKKRDKKQLQNCQKPFQEWLKVFDSVFDSAISGDGEFGKLGGWAEMLKLMDKEQEERNQGWLETLEKTPLKNRVNPSKTNDVLSKEKLKASVKVLLASLEAPVSIEGAYMQRIWQCVFCVTLPLFLVLAYSVFGGDELTLTTFIAVQASIVAIFFKTTELKQFEREALGGALAYRVSRFHNHFHDDFQPNGGLCFKKKCRGCCEQDLSDVLTGYHKWRAMALYKMRLMLDKKT